MGGGGGLAGLGFLGPSNFAYVRKYCDRTALECSTLFEDVITAPVGSSLGSDRNRFKGDKCTELSVSSFVIMRQR